MTRLFPLALVVLVALAPVLTSCSDTETPPPIVVRDTGQLVVQNQTSFAWSNVEIWVNDHYRGAVPSLAEGQVVNVPLGNLMAGYGQRFDTRKQAVFGVLVTARASDGSPVRLTWGKVRRQ